MVALGLRVGGEKHPWGFRHTVGAAGRTWRNRGLLARSLSGSPTPHRGGVGGRTQRRQSTHLPCRGLQGPWQERGCPGHAESPAGHSAVCFSGGSCTHRGSAGRAVQLLGQRFSAGVEGVGLSVPEGHSPEGRRALLIPGPQRARTCQGRGESSVSSHGLDSSAQSCYQGNIT